MCSPSCRGLMYSALKLLSSEMLSHMLRDSYTNQALIAANSSVNFCVVSNTSIPMQLCAKDPTHALTFACRTASAVEPDHSLVVVAVVVVLVVVPLLLVVCIAAALVSSASTRWHAASVIRCYMLVCNTTVVGVLAAVVAVLIGVACYLV
jgi:hypothetical protein